MEKISDFLFTGVGVLPATLAMAGYAGEAAVLFIVLLIAALAAAALSPDAPYRRTKDDD